MDVLEHEQERRLGADADEQVGDGRVQPVALGVGIRGRHARQLADPLLEAGHETGQLPSSRTEVPAQDLRLGVGDEVVERGRERAVRRSHDAVAVAVEDGRALGRDVVRQLAHEAALPRPGLARDERRAASLRRRSAAAAPAVRRARGHVRRTRTSARAGVGPEAGLRVPI